MGQAIEQQIEQALGAKIVSASSLGVGFGLSGLRARLVDGREIAVKAGQPRRAGHLELEAYMLEELNRTSDLPVPQVYYVDETLLAMSWIENSGGGFSAAVERHAAELLAAFHATPYPACGYQRDTVIGPLHQPNPQIAGWVEFFRDHRLLFMAREAHREGRLPGTLRARLETLAEKLDHYIDEPAHLALLHGDLWTGNVLVDGDCIAGFIDPAIYCGHPEIELAFTTMFGTFGEAFFDAYNAISPIAQGFHELRREIYNLYPTLVHVRLFGASYLPPIEALLRRLGL